MEELLERHGVKRLAVTGGWRKYWKYWGGRGFLKKSLSIDNLDSPYIRDKEEGVYDFKLVDIVNFLDGKTQEELAHSNCFCLYWKFNEL